MSNIFNAFYTTNDAARFCGVGRRTMLRWAKQGAIATFETEGGHHRISRQNLITFMKKKGIPLPGGLSSERVLIVDDEEAITKYFKLHIERYLPNGEVKVAHSGLEAGILLSGFLPHVVFLDIVMPGLGGDTVCSGIRSNSDLSNTKIVVVSGYLNEKLENRLYSLGVDLCLRKPIGGKQIGRALRKFIDLETLEVQKK